MCDGMLDEATSVLDTESEVGAAFVFFEVCFEMSCAVCYAECVRVRWLMLRQHLTQSPR
jgi:hypothetical protein